MENETILILANSEGKAWDFANKVYQKLNNNPNRERKYQLVKVEIKKFNDGEIFTKILENVREKQCYFIHDGSMNSQDWFVSLALINCALMRSSAGKINNVLPYMKYSRQDRMTEPRTPISTKVVSDMITLRADRVLTADLHNPASASNYSIPFDNLKAYQVLISYLRNQYPDFLKESVLVAPDVGSAQRVESYAKRMGLDVAIAHKKREQAGVISDMTIIGNVENKNCIIVDDMIDTGGTLCKAAEVLKQKGARDVWAVATHGVFSNNAKERLNQSCFSKIIVTDSIPQNNDGKIEIVSLVNLFAETIYRISHGLSVSELFK